MGDDCVKKRVGSYVPLLCSVVGPERPGQSPPVPERTVASTRLSVAGLAGVEFQNCTI